MRDKDQTNRSGLDEFNAKLHDTIIHQARKLINNRIYVKSLLSTLPVALIATDEKGLIKTVNLASEKILGIDLKTVEGEKLDSVFQDNPDLVNKFQQSLTEGRQFQFSAKSIQLKPNDKIVANVDLQPIRDEERQICGLLITIEDQTYVNFLKDAFKRYVPPSVSEIIAKNPQYLELGGEEKELTVLFSDLIGFTTLSEKLPPNRIVKLLSDYFDEMTALVFENEGTLKEYVADELMAIFGAPVYQSDHAKRACSTAISMSKRLGELRKKWAQQNRPQLRARIGVNTGTMLVGNLGSSFRFSYGVTGDQVNLGSRLEGLSSIYGTEILIGENTKEKVNNDFHFREIDFVRVKGRNQPLRIFELIDHAGRHLSKSTQISVDAYEKALSLYRKRDWNGALEIFAGTKELEADGPSRVLTERCRNYLHNPPAFDWDGVFEHKTK